MSLGIRLAVEEFIKAAKEFCEISDRIHNGWQLYMNNTEEHKTFIKKETFINHCLNGIDSLFKAEYIIFYNLSFGVPSFSFNVWDSTGALLTLEDIRQMSFITIKKEDFYSVITQQEHPVIHRPYFIMHPCHTPLLLADFKDISKNIIVTFLGLITPLLRLNLPLEYGM